MMEQFPNLENQENPRVKVIKAAFEQYNAEIAPMTLEDVAKGDLSPQETLALSNLQYIETKLAA